MHKFSPDGELLMSLGVAGQAGNDSAHFNGPNDVIVAPDGSIFVSDGHDGQQMTSVAALEEGRRAGKTGRVMKFAADGNHRLDLFDLEGNYLESRYSYGRISGIHITDDNIVYATDSESDPIRHVNWIAGVRIGPLDEDRLTGFIPGYPDPSRNYQSTAGEGVAVDADGTVFVAEGPASIPIARGAFTRYSAD